MHVLLYAMVAAWALVLPLRLWLQDRRDALRGAYLVFGLNLAWTFLFWAIYLATGDGILNRFAVAGSVFLPASLFSFVARLFPRTIAIDRRGVWLWILAPAVTVTWLVAEHRFWPAHPRASPADILVGVYLYTGLAITVQRLVREHLRNPHRVERARIRYLLVLLGGAILFVLVESLARTWTLPPEAGTLDLWTGAVRLQGAVPPVGVLFVALLVFFLHQVLVLSRLLDLHEIVSRTLAIAACGLLLALVESAAVLWTGSFRISPVHAAFLMMVATVLFLAVYDPLRQVVERLTGNWFNRRGRILDLTLEEVDRALPRAIRAEALFEALLDPMVASGRVPAASVWLWDQEHHQFRLQATRGQGSPIGAVAPGILEPGTGRPPLWVRADVVRESHRAMANPASGARARLLEAMGADLALPLVAGDLLLGWVGLKDEPWSDGFSQEEVQRLRRTVDRAALVLENLHGFERLKEQHRLAALGTMSAGLAHEIRNPLAGIKGAAQVLAQSGLEGEERELLDVILAEVDRLDVVVRQFLDYARPDETESERVDVREVVAHVASLLRSQELPPDLEIRVETAADLVVAGSAARLGQVVLNLALNAVEAMPRGGVLTFRTRTGPPLDRIGGRPSVEIEVEDTGPGIAPEDLDKVFIPFFTSRPDGVGLGLAICRRIAEAHGGFIEVASQPGRGARFTVRLPSGD
jgi:two-component system, NtrC family, sensor histidine kinase HydH